MIKNRSATTEEHPMTFAEFTRQDAGEQREHLASEMAQWIADEFWTTAAAKRFMAKVRIVARRLGVSREQIIDTARADAQALAA